MPSDVGLYNRLTVFLHVLDKASSEDPPENEVRRHKVGLGGGLAAFTRKTAGEVTKLQPVRW